MPELRDELAEVEAMLASEQSIPADERAEYEELRDELRGLIAARSATRIERTLVERDEDGWIVGTKKFIAIEYPAS